MFTIFSFIIVIILAYITVFLLYWHFKHQLADDSSIHQIDRVMVVLPVPKKIHTSIDDNMANPNGIVSILLQQSPVAMNAQISRLETIDNISWGRWVDIESSVVNIFASIPILGNDSSLPGNFHKIKPIVMIYPRQMVVHPFHHLVRGLLSLLTCRPHMKWLILANDHTFIIPQNLNWLYAPLNVRLPKNHHFIIKQMRTKKDQAS